MLTYDLYQAYIHPKATGKQLVRFSHYTVIGFSILCAGIAAGLNHAGFNVSCAYYLRCHDYKSSPCTVIVTAVGIFVDSAVVPMACTILWSKQNKAAVIFAPLLGSIAAIIAWLLTARSQYGYLSIATLSENLPLVAGNMMSLTGPLVLVPLITYLKPDNYDFELLKNIKQADDAEEGDASIEEFRDAEIAHVEAHSSDNSTLLRARKWALITSIVMTISYLILWPIPMYGSHYGKDIPVLSSWSSANPTTVFSRGFFKGWVVVLFLWAFYASMTITLLPIWEGRKSLKLFVIYIVKGRRGITEATLPEVTEGEDVKGEAIGDSKGQTPEEKTSNTSEIKTA